MNKMLLISVVFITVLLSSAAVSAESISGYVLDVDGDGILGVDVSDNASVGSTTTNATGYYTISGYTNLSTYIMSADKNGYVDNTLSVDVNGDMTNQNITMSATSLLSFIQDAEAVVASVSGITTDVLSIFMSPPLVFFLGLVIFGIVARMIRSFLRG